MKSLEKAIALPHPTPFKSWCLKPKYMSQWTNLSKVGNCFLLITKGNLPIIINIKMPSISYNAVPTQFGSLFSLGMPCEVLATSISLSILNLTYYSKMYVINLFLPCFGFNKFICTQNRISYLVAQKYLQFYLKHWQFFFHLAS